MITLHRRPTDRDGIARAAETEWQGEFRVWMIRLRTSFMGYLLGFGDIDVYWDWDGRCGSVCKGPMRRLDLKRRQSAVLNRIYIVRIQIPHSDCDSLVG